MQPSLGWTLLSREALRKAEKNLDDVQQGVRDEIGFLALHQGYADRFFPGTSVLQTRLRYVFFVPWTYQRLAKIKLTEPFGQALKTEEKILAGPN